MSDEASELRDGGTTERAARTQDDILEVATAEFAANGYAGARVDEIAARTRTTKRMIYYYFGSTEGLYLAVLERVSARSGGSSAASTSRSSRPRMPCARSPRPRTTTTRRTRRSSSW